jgi:hypothetical protein
VLGQLAQQFFVEPLHEQAKLIREIAYVLAYYAPIYGNPSPGRVVLRPDGVNLTAETEDKIRALGSQLIAMVTTTRWRGLADSMFLPPRKDLLEGAHTLIGLSNSVRTGTPQGNLEIRNRALKLLRID